MSGELTPAIPANNKATQQDQRSAIVSKKEIYEKLSKVIEDQEKELKEKEKKINKLREEKVHLTNFINQLVTENQSLKLIKTTKESELNILLSNPSLCPGCFRDNVI